MRGYVQTQASLKTTLLVFGFLLAFRIVNALSIKTFFQPDEYFQSLEPAWQQVFGPDSGAWITWEWREHLRSSLHPLLFAGVYQGANSLCSILGLDRTSAARVLLAAPKLFQGAAAAFGDLFIWRFGCSLYGPGSRASWASLLLTITSPFQFFCSVRSFSNSLETTLTVAALQIWPWSFFISAGSSKRENAKDSPAEGLVHSLTLAALACILRPTNVIIWATISIFLLIRSGDVSRLQILLSSAVLCGSAVAAVSTAIDTAYFGTLTFPPLKFLYFNVVQSLAVFYGKNRPDYYFTEGLPLLLTSMLPFGLAGLWLSFRSSRQIEPTQEVARLVLQALALTVLVTTTVLSLISHKEVRFIFPLLPILIVLAGKPLAKFTERQSPIRLAALSSLGLISVVIIYYLGFVHQRGVIDVMHFLRQEQETKFSNSASSSSSNITVGFLMPCHSTPWRSHLVHPEIIAWALTCEPPLDIPLNERGTYLDEADVFYTDPAVWMTSNMADAASQRDLSVLRKSRQRPWPEYLVFFEQLKPTLEEAVKNPKYEECWRGFNTHWHDDWRRQGDIVVWCRRDHG